MRLTAAVAALLFGALATHSANAQTATYKVILTNYATYPIYGDYDPPTTTNGMPGVWFTGGIIGQNGGQQTATLLTITPAMTNGISTFYSGTTDSAPAPYYVAEYECSFTIYPGSVSSSGCTAPNIVPAVTHSISGTNPRCPKPTAVPKGTCNYEIPVSFYSK